MSKQIQLNALIVITILSWGGVIIGAKVGWTLAALLIPAGVAGVAMGLSFELVRQMNSNSREE